MCDHRLELWGIDHDDPDNGGEIDTLDYVNGLRVEGAYIRGITKLQLLAEKQAFLYPDTANQLVIADLDCGGYNASYEPFMRCHQCGFIGGVSKDNYQCCTVCKHEHVERPPVAPIKIVRRRRPISVRQTLASSTSTIQVSS